MQRRGFLASILAAGVAPAFVGSSILMPVRAIATPATVRIWQPKPYQRAALEYEAPRFAESFIRTAGALSLGDRFTIAGVDRLWKVTAILEGGVAMVSAR